MNETCNNIKQLNRTLSALDIYHLVIIPVICVFGMITNLLNIIIFSNIKMKKPTFKLMLAMSINDLIYLALCFPLSVYYCENCQELRLSEWYTIYLHYIDDYFTSGQAFFSILIDIVLAVDRYRMISNKKYVQNLSFKWEILLMAVISLFFFFPVIFFKSRYECPPNFIIRIYTKRMYETIYLVLIIIRFILAVFVLSIINFKILTKFSLMFRRKALMKNEPKRTTLETIRYETRYEQQKIPCDNLKEMRASRNMTLMVLFTCATNFIGMLPYSLTRIMRLTDLTNDDWFNEFDMITTCFLLFSHSCTFFIYYSFNSMFFFISRRYFKNTCFIFYRKISVEL